MRWPFVSRRVFEIEIVHRDEQIVDAVAREVYWRTRAEKLMDQALARAGAISEPTMVERKVSKEPSAAATMIAAMSITEIGKPQEPER